MERKFSCAAERRLLFFHKANENDPATFEHYGQRIAVIVTPNYCGRCHAKEQAQFAKSHHAQAAQFIGSLDNMLGEVVEGGPAANNGCRQCHGSKVKYLKDGKFDYNTWPNSGIGRTNPDGSKGTCRMSREALIQFEGRARQKIVASVTWDRTISRSRFTPNRNTASNSEPTSTR